MKLKELNPCRYSERIGSTIRNEWEKSASDAEWLFKHAHIKGTMPRKMLIEVTLNRIEFINDKMPDASKKVMIDLRRWIAGEDIDLVAVRATADAAFAAARAAAYAVYADAVDIRKYITVEEICSYLELNPDEVLE